MTCSVPKASRTSRPSMCLCQLECPALQIPIGPGPSSAGALGRRVDVLGLHVCTAAEQQSCPQRSVFSEGCLPTHWLGRKGCIPPSRAGYETRGRGESEWVAVTRGPHGSRACQAQKVSKPRRVRPRQLFGQVQQISLPCHRHRPYLPELQCASPGLNAVPFRFQQGQCVAAYEGKADSG